MSVPVPPLARLSSVATLASAAILLLGAPAAPAAVVWYTSDPIAVRLGASVGPKLTFQLDGAADSVAIVPPSPGAVLPLAHQGGNVWSVTLTADQALSGVPTTVNQIFLGALQVRTGATTKSVLNVALLVANDQTPPVDVVTISPSLRRTGRIVNLLVPDLPLDWNSAGGRYPSIVSSFLSAQGDDYDFVQVIYGSPQFPMNRFHAGVRTSVRGIGSPNFSPDSGSVYGSAARLLGVTIYPNTIFFNDADPTFSHETGHQWSNYSTHPLLHPGSPHWPPSTMALGIMGVSLPPSMEGMGFSYEIQQSGGTPTWRLTSTVLNEFNDIDLYYMGLFAPGEVTPQLVAGDASAAVCDGCPVGGGVKSVTIADIVSSQGARVPDSASTRRTLRFGEVVVTRDRLLTDDEMSYLDAMSARGEATTLLPVVYAGPWVDPPWRVATCGRGTAQIRLVPPGAGSRDAEQVVPIVLDVTSKAHYTTELSLANLSPSPLTLTATYAASLGSGSGTVSETLAVGEQRVIPDAIAWLRSKSLPIPATGSRAGTLTFRPPWNLPAPYPLAVTARTTSPVTAPLPVGTAGLGYAAPPPAAAFLDSATVYGLRETDRDRSNLAVVNPGTIPVTVRVTAFSGDGDGRSTVTHDGVVLSPGGWTQFNGALAEGGFSNGWVRIDRTSTSGSFAAYGVVNDNTTDDGSFILPVGGTYPGTSLTLPVLVEGPLFRSELVLANRSSHAVTFRLEYLESLHPERGAGGAVSVVVPPRTQRIVPEAIAFLRSGGAAIGTSGSDTLAGAVRISVSGAPLADVFVGARTAAQAGTGQFGLFYVAVPRGGEAGSEALVTGLRAGPTLRSNVAVLNAGTNELGPITLELQVLDGSNGSTPWGPPVTATLEPGRWAQPLSLGASTGPASALVRVRRISGKAPWIAYGVVNDGGNPGERTGDGAFVEMHVP